MRDFKKTVDDLRIHEKLFNERDAVNVATLYRDAADAIEELLAAVPKWISVEERLPKKKVGDEGYVGYLVLSDGEYQIADFTHDKYMQTAYEFHVDGEYDPNVTHWMELPPKEVQDA